MLRSRACLLRAFRSPSSRSPFAEVGLTSPPGAARDFTASPAGRSQAENTILQRVQRVSSAPAAESASPVDTVSSSASEATSRDGIDIEAILALRKKKQRRPAVETPPKSASSTPSIVSEQMDNHIETPIIASTGLTVAVERGASKFSAVESVDAHVGVHANTPSGAAADRQKTGAQGSIDGLKSAPLPKLVMHLVYKLAGELAAARDPEGKGRALLLDRCKQMGVPVRLPSPTAAPAGPGMDWTASGSRKRGAQTTQIVAPLDAQSEGLVIITDDGILAQYLNGSGMSNARRVYKVRTRGELPEYALRQLARGGATVVSGDLRPPAPGTRPDSERSADDVDDERRDDTGGADRYDRDDRSPRGQRNEPRVDRGGGRRRMRTDMDSGAEAASADAEPTDWKSIRDSRERVLKPMVIRLDTPSKGGEADDKQSSPRAGDDDGRDGDDDSKSRAGNHTKPGKQNKWYSVTTYNNSTKDIRDAFARYGVGVSRILRVSFGSFDLGKIPKGGALEIPVPRHIVEASRRAGAHAQLKK